MNQDQQNGNTQLNQTRNDFNDRVNRKKFLEQLQEFIGIHREDLEQFNIKKEVMRLNAFIIDEFYSNVDEVRQLH